MKITNAAEFGKALRKRRKELHYTQADLSAFTGISVSFLSDLENGKATTELGKALFIANTLGLDCLLNERGAKWCGVQELTL
jgi:transcriptional regulator with XRE-family HTH domain